MGRVQAVDIHNAAVRLSRRVSLTPILASAELNRELGVDVVCKAENLQRTGSFKYRGAMNHMLNLSADELTRGVVGASSGNHAYALSVAANILGTRAVVVMPNDAPSRKMEAVKTQGAEIYQYSRSSENRDSLVEELAADKGLSIVPSSDSWSVIAGAGTVGLELMQQLARPPGVLLMPLGGGGLAAGCAIITKALSCNTKVIGVEPATGNDTALSLMKGQRVTIKHPITIADGLRHTIPSYRPFLVNQGLLDDVLIVHDSEIVEAMRLCLRYFGMLIEPSGACALAALVSGRFSGSDTVAVVLSGGNIHENTFHSLVRSDGS
jgi:threonine dehydratase